MTTWFAVMLGGAAGSAARYGVSLWTKNLWPGFPTATLMVNAAGGLLMGFIAAYALDRPEFPAWLRLGLTTGVLGGFTTFSAFSFETLELWREGSMNAALLNVALNLVLSLGACALGLWLARAATA
ncbi:MAG: fluoride efflux transporter CrcB [Pseudomonadota bacterium]